MRNKDLEITLKEKGLISRLTNKTFRFPKSISKGFYSANYFLKSRKIVSQNRPNHIVTMQWFQRKDMAKLCGIDEVIALIHTFAHKPEDLEIHALNDGDMISKNEPVLKVKGRYEDFGFLESLIDGILTRRTSVCTNVYEVMKVIGNKDIFSMADRQDDFKTQVGDGYATYIGGIDKFSTDAQGYWIGKKGIGTMPHALIQICGGDLTYACDLYLKTYPHEKITALVDYHNDVINDSLILARSLKDKLKAVRVDTSKSLIDKYFDDKDISQFDAHGVCKELIFALRDALNLEGFNYVKIIVSSSFEPSKIKLWNELKVPVDMYGVGTYFVNNMTVGFTGDLVNLDGKDEAKVGRNEIFSDRLKKVSYPIY